MVQNNRPPAHAPNRHDGPIPAILLEALMRMLAHMHSPAAKDAAMHVMYKDGKMRPKGGITPAKLGLFEHDLLLQALNCIAYLEPRISTRNLAGAYMHTAAARRGISRQQLENLLASPCGLDVDGLFDYGPRQFRLVLGQQHTPLVREPGGRLHTSLPRAGTRDDAALVAQSHERWS
ncbi:MAG: hypothetical protein MUD01_06225, partial [Chloroflexaceae bacterium]|nr:hypothetical protein [Chloroflexaceae bacterium]